MALKSGTRNHLRAAMADPGASNEVKNVLEVVEGGVAGATFTIGTESANAIIVSIQLTDDNGDDIAAASAVTILLFDDAAGAAFNTDDFTIAAGTDGAVAEAVADKVIHAVSESDGDIDLSLTIAGAATTYVAVVLPGGKMAISAVVTHAA